jgi:hypothetical protein
VFDINDGCVGFKYWLSLPQCELKIIYVYSEWLLCPSENPLIFEIKLHLSSSPSFLWISGGRQFQQHGGLTSIEIPHLNNKHEKTDIPEEATVWKRVTDPTVVEDKLLTRNKQHFSQAQGTLFTRPEMQDHIKYEGVSQAVDILLQGTVQIPNSALKTKGGKTLLQHLSNKNTLPEMNCDINIHTFTSALRKRSEGTLTSPSGRHLGHYKCPLVDDKKDNNYTLQNPATKDKIMEVYSKSPPLH